MSFFKFFPRHWKALTAALVTTLTAIGVYKWLEDNA